VQVALRDFGQAVEAHHPYPAGPLLGGPEGQAEAGHGLFIFLTEVPSLRVMPQVAAEGYVVN